jgi:hypothetical protein
MYKSEIVKPTCKEESEQFPNLHKSPFNAPREKQSDCVWEQGAEESIWT